ncbi:MAG: ribosomal small subunit methyltransferase [Betaproteobacteria bacterium]|nr:ribosomal small subunit methyltransferase [Betaproteobacteria bacterium]
MEQSSLYVVATPIGNLADITLRALDVLKRCDVIAAEDTRNALHLLKHHGIDTRVISLHEHNERTAAYKLVDLLAQGKSIALITDAGTPAISDPGALAVCAVREAGYPVVPIPGANAAICALSAAGITAPHFLFYGFLPQQAAARKRELEALKASPYLLVFYEAPHRVAASIAAMAEVLGDRTVTIARELTKLFETMHRCALGEAAAWFEADANQLKGEFVLLVEGAPTAAAPDAVALTHVLEVLMRELSLKQAVKLATELTGARKNDVYELALALGKGA